MVGARIIVCVVKCAERLTPRSRSGPTGSSQSKILVMHGKQDKKVSIEHSKKLEKTLDAEFLYYDGDHSLKGTPAQAQALEWFNRHLK